MFRCRLGDLWRAGFIDQFHRIFFTFKILVKKNQNIFLILDFPDCNDQKNVDNNFINIKKFNFYRYFRKLGNVKDISLKSLINHNKMLQH